MQDIESDCAGRDAGQGSPAHVDEVNAHLRVIPGYREAFKVVMTFHHADGSLFEAVLEPTKAASLLVEIGRAIEQGLVIAARGTTAKRGDMSRDWH